MDTKCSPTQTLKNPLPLHFYSDCIDFVIVYIYCIVFSFRFFVTTSMPKIRTQRTKQPPEGFEAIEQILDGEFIVRSIYQSIYQVNRL